MVVKIKNLRPFFWMSNFLDEQFLRVLFFILCYPDRAWKLRSMVRNSVNHSGSTFYIDRHTCKQFTKDQRDLALLC